MVNGLCFHPTQRKSAVLASLRLVSVAETWHSECCRAAIEGGSRGATEKREQEQEQERERQSQAQWITSLLEQRRLLRHLQRRQREVVATAREERRKGKSLCHRSHNVAEKEGVAG